MVKKTYLVTGTGVRGKKYKRLVVTLAPKKTLSRSIAISANKGKIKNISIRQVSKPTGQKMQKESGVKKSNYSDIRIGSKKYRTKSISI